MLFVLCMTYPEPIALVVSICCVWLGVPCLSLDPVGGRDKVPPQPLIHKYI